MNWLRAAREPRWRALAGAFVTVVLAQGLSNSFPVFLLPISDDLGGLRSLSAAVYSVHNLVMGLVGTVVDALMRRVGERRIMLAGAVIMGGGVALAATADSPLGLLLWFGVIAGGGAGLLGSVAQLVVLSRWFPTARGAVNGVAFSGMGLGIFLAAPLTALLVDHVGWRWAMASLGAGAGLLLLPAVLLTPRLMTEPSASPAPSAAHSDDGPGLSAALGRRASGASRRRSSSRRSRTSWSRRTRSPTSWRPGSTRGARRRRSGRWGSCRPSGA